MDPYQNPNPKGYQGQMPFGLAGDGGSGSSDIPRGTVDNKQKKKLLHRDIERQRRQEMATLFASLRDHLPLQYIKGKRAVSDHVNGAVKFIKDTETRIKELSERRDELSRETCQSYKSNPDIAGTASGLGNSFPASVLVQPCVSGFEVAVSSNSSGPEALPLSRVLESLQELGLEVVSSLTTRVNERFMHSIRVEVNNFGCLDLTWLQQKLIEELILSTGNS